MDKIIGGWQIIPILDELNKFPQKVATAYIKVMQKFVGFSLSPILYAGSQVVNDGINYTLICNFVSVQEHVTKIVKLVINVNSGTQEASIVSIDDVLS